MSGTDIQLDGDPRTLARAILRAAREAYRERHDGVGDWDEMRGELETEVPKLAKEMVAALEGEVRDVYLMNALEIMALSYARRQSRERD
jgi:hypothetical protein